MKIMGKYLFIIVISHMLIIGNYRCAHSGSFMHFSNIKTTPFMVDFIGEIKIHGLDAKPGDEIGVFTKDGILCGACIINKPGQYGILHVYMEMMPLPLKKRGLFWVMSLSFEYGRKNLTLNL